MTNIHNPVRLENETQEDYRLRRLQSRYMQRKNNHPEKAYTPIGIGRHYLSYALIGKVIGKQKNTKHTRTNSLKRKGACGVINGVKTLYAGSSSGICIASQDSIPSV